MKAWLRGFLEVLIAQVAICLLAGLVGQAAGIVAAMLAEPDPKNLGLAIGMLLGGLFGFLVAFVILWLLAWWWFRRRMPADRFLLSWLGSFVLVWLAAPLAGGGGWRVERVEGPPLVFWRPAPDAPAFALSPGPGEVGIDGAFVERRCEMLNNGYNGEVCFLVAPGGVPEGARLRRREVLSEPVWWKPGRFRDVGERIEERPVEVRDAPPPRIAALSWKVAEGRLVVRVESEAPLVVDALCFRFDGELQVRTGAGGDALLLGAHCRFDDGEWMCASDGGGVTIPALVQGARDFALPTLPGWNDPEDNARNARVVRQIRKWGLAGGRESVRTEVRLLGRYPGLHEPVPFICEPVPVRIDAVFDLRPELE